MSAVPAPNVEVARGVSMTEYRVRGPLWFIFQHITSLLEQKHPAGYGTRVHSIEWDFSGEYVARISHANSCE